MKNKKIVLIIIIGAILIVGYYLASPLFLDKKVMEDFPIEDVNKEIDMRENEEIMNEKSKNGNGETEISARGNFEGLAGHNAAGKAVLIKSGDKKYVRFEEDFEITNGPDLFVHLGRDGEYDKEVNLGPLKGNIGSQNYEIPENVKIEEYNEVWIWCRAFSVPFGKAEFSQ